MFDSIFLDTNIEIVVSKNGCVENNYMTKIIVVCQNYIGSQY